MATYYVDDGGNNTDGLSWATAYTSFTSLDIARTLASNDVVYIGHDHVDQYAHSANRIMTGPASGNPVKVYSVTQGTTTYQAGTSNVQIDTSEGNYYLLWNGVFAFYGVNMKAGNAIIFAGARNLIENCKLFPGNNSYVSFGTTDSFTKIRNITVDYAADTFDNTTRLLAFAEHIDANNITLLNGGRRTGHMFTANSTGSISGINYVAVDKIAGFMDVTVTNTSRDLSITNCNGAYLALSNTNTVSSPTFNVMLTNNVVSASGVVAQLEHQNYAGRTLSTTARYRQNGATASGQSYSWGITTSSNLCPCFPYHTPWIYAYIETPGPCSPTLYITNDGGNFTTTDVWLEAQYLNTSSTLNFTHAQTLTPILTTATTISSDSSTWIGTGPTFAYKQKLSTPITIAAAGLCRFRLAVSYVNVLSSRYVFLDPTVYIE